MPTSQRRWGLGITGFIENSKLKLSKDYRKNNVLTSNCSMCCPELTLPLNIIKD